MLDHHSVMIGQNSEWTIGVLDCYTALQPHHMYACRNLARILKVDSDGRLIIGITESILVEAVCFLQRSA